VEAFISSGATATHILAQDGKVIGVELAQTEGGMITTNWKTSPDDQASSEFA
jgi:hypothetical protein